jgi:hypothetical protein
MNLSLLLFEGAELELFMATDFERVTFDVIAIETLGLDEVKDKASISFLESKGYILYASVGRNAWLISHEMAIKSESIKV